MTQAPEHRTRAAVPAWARTAGVVSVLALSAAALIAATGGFTATIAGVKLVARSPVRPLALGLLAALVRFVLTRDAAWVGRVLTVSFFVFVVGGFFRPGAGFSALIGFGAEFSDRALPAVRATAPVVQEDSGYDGQFYAQIAVDPLLRDPTIRVALDDPGYRARRVLFSWTAWLLGLGRPAWVLEAFALQNVIAWLLLAWLLARWMRPETRRGFALWFGCLFAGGLATSVRYALVDGPSLLLVVLAVLAVERGRGWAATGLLALAGLGKETSLVAGTMLIRPGARRPADLAALAAKGLATVLPLALWLAYVRWGAGLELSAGLRNFGLPFQAWLGKWIETVSELASSGLASFARFNLYALVSLTTQAAWLMVRRDPASAWWRVGASHVAFMAVLGPAVWDGYGPAATRVLLPMTVAFNVQLARERRLFWPLFVLGNLTILHAPEILRVPWLWTHL
jgi:hypothetical protein